MKTFAGIFFLAGIIYTSNGLELFPSNQADVSDALKAIFSMGVKLDTLLNTNSTQPQNFLVSPLSLTLLLGQLLVGAEGKFRDHLYDLISLSDQKSVRDENVYIQFHQQLGNLRKRLEIDGNRHYKLDSNNALFYNRNIRLQDKFSHESMTLYQTELFPLNFKRSEVAMKTINKWALDHTNGLIKNIVATPPGPETASIFANAIYFYGKWAQPFSNELNHLGPFFVSKSDQRQVTYMVNFLEQVPYAESKRLNCKMLVMPYENNELGMYIVLPNVGHPHEHDIRAFASEAKISDYLQMLGDLKNHEVNVKIPKFTLTSSMSLLKPLQMYATYKKYMESRQFTTEPTKSTATKNFIDVLEDKKAQFELFKHNFNNFTSGSNIDEIILSAASVKGDLRVSDVMQHMTFALNEVGTEAAAVSAGIVDYSGGAKNFLANKPFLFFIRHEATAATLFWGTITNPS